MLTREQIKEAGIIKRQLKKGLVNIPQLDAFLSRIEEKKSPKRTTNAFDFQMQNLNNGRSKKPKKNHQL